VFIHFYFGYCNLHILLLEQVVVILSPYKVEAQLHVLADVGDRRERGTVGVHVHLKSGSGSEAGWVMEG